MDFVADVADMYQVLGTPAMHTAAATGISTALHVLFAAQGGAGGLDGVMQADAPELRMAAAALDVKPRPGDVFLLGGQTWQVAAPAVPLNDGAEYAVPVRRAAT